MTDKRNRGRPDSTPAVDRTQSRSQYRERLVLDRDDLDTAAVEQPTLFYEVSEQVTYAQSRRDELKLELEQTVALVDGDLRANYVKAEKKPTDTAIAREIETDKSVRSLKAELAEAVATLGQWQALKEAMDQRKDMLKVLAQLYAANYFTRNGVTASVSRMDSRDADEARRLGGQERRSRMPTKG